MLVLQENKNAAKAAKNIRLTDTFFDVSSKNRRQLMLKKLKKIIIIERYENQLENFGTPSNRCSALYGILIKNTIQYFNLAMKI